MRNLYELDRWREKTERIMDLYGSYGDDKGGAFLIPILTEGVKLRCIASSDLGWDHVSVSLDNRCPTWAEMDFVKRAFFLPDEVAMQLHVAERDHINFNPRTLHIWRPHDAEIPLPPKMMV